MSGSSISEASQLEIDNMLRRNSSPQILMSASKPRNDANELCRVCGDTSAKTHYGVLTCFGCKGFFRRALKRPAEYQCRHNGTCVVDKHERNSCRYCRFKKCLEVGMDPKAVRPDRDATGRHQGRARRSKIAAEDEGEIDSEWTRKLPVDMRTTLMQLMNVELLVNSGDGGSDGKTIYPLKINSLRQVLEDPSVLDGKRTEMRYEAYRQIEQCELVSIAHRRMLAVIDWVDHLFDMMDIHGVEDKLTLVKYGFAPLTVFSFCAATAATKQHDVLYQCNYGYAPRNVGQTYEDAYHLANRVVSKSLDEIIEPFQYLNLREEECVLLKAILLLNPHAKPLSTDASESIADLRDRIQETLYHVVRETHPKEVASSRFGNLLLFSPSIMNIGAMMVENLQFVDSIMHTMTDPLMKDFLSLHDEENDTHGLQAEQVLTQNGSLESRMNHSESSSSIESLASNPSSSSYQTHGSMPYNCSTSSLPGLAGQNQNSPLNTASSMPNLGQMTSSMNTNDTDPDYNLTLTPDMFTGIRQAMDQNGLPHVHSNGSNAMDVDMLPRVATPPNSPEQNQQRPQFFISTVESTKHKFTVTTSFDRYTNEYQQPTLNTGQYMQNGAVPQAPQQPLARTNSLPPHQQFQTMQSSYPQQQVAQQQQMVQQQMVPQQMVPQQMQQQPIANGYTNQSMEYDDTYYQ